MKKALSVILGLAFLLSVLFTPFVSQATTNDEQSAEELIASLEAKIADLQAEINELLAQLKIIKGQRKQAQTALQLARRLSLGMSGDDIKLLQEFLATDPDIYPEGLVTGYFGRLTKAAVTRFQAKMGVEQVGQVGPKTFSKINELLTEGAGSSGKVPPGLLVAPGIKKKISFFFVPDITEPEDENEEEEEVGEEDEEEEEETDEEENEDEEESEE